jgi:alpha-L-fucosidase 2
VNYWDHLHDGKQAYDSLQVMIRQSTFSNLMDTHPPGLFQIDGNLGAANGMLEALVQSRWMPDAAEIELLPALPKEWANGSVEGLRVRGGATLSMHWADGKITSLQLHSAQDGSIKLMLPKQQSIASIRNSDGKSQDFAMNGTLKLKANTSYEVRFH